MASNGNIEERISTLEREVALLKRQLGRNSNNGESHNWVDDVSGSMADIPREELDKFRQYCREFRESQTDP